MRILVLLLAFLLLPAAGIAESLPLQAGLDAAQAVAAMHDAVMADVLGRDYRFSELAGADGIFVLYTDPEAHSYLMVSLGEAGDSADMAIVQSYTLAEFDNYALPSMTALATPFIPDDNFAAFEEWRDATASAVAAAAANGSDMELTYYTGEYIACAMSVYHDDVGAMFTALVSWHTPLTAEDITLRMEGMADGSADSQRDVPVPEGAAG